MSVEALVDAVVARLRAALSLTDAECGAQPGGVPPHACGQLYVAVHEGDSSNDSATSIDERVGVLVTVTMRGAYAPGDRRWQDVLRKPGSGLHPRCRAVRGAVHMDYTVLAAANLAIGADADGFVEPLKWRGTSAPEWKGPDWFGAEPDPSRLAGVTATIAFEDALRIQANGSTT